MSLGTSNRDGGKTSESGHLRALAKLVSGDIIEGLAVSQRGAGANMSVDVAIGDAFLRRSDGTYAHPVFNDAVYNQVISAADGSNPRRDIIVAYVDYGQAPSTAVSNNTNGVVKIKVVAGTPAGSPVDPNGAAIQSSVGAGNPYTILARVRVPAGQTSISNTLIDDLRVIIYANANFVAAAGLQDSAVTTSKINNNGVTSTKIDFTTLASIQEKGANSQPKLYMQTGWDYGNSVGGQNTINKPITFPVPYTKLVSLVITPLGTAAANATVNSPSDLSSSYSGGYVGFGVPTNTGFTAKLSLISGNYGGTNERWGFSWVAFGVL